MARMRCKQVLRLSCLLPFVGIVCGSPIDQQPLISDGHDDVQKVRAELKKAQIIPTVIDDFLPSLTLSISWSSKDAKLGNTIKSKHLQSQPTIRLDDITNPIDSARSGLQYTITLTDPDAPSRKNPKWSEMCHWIATNVPLSQHRFSILPIPQHGLVDESVHEQDSKPDDVVEYKPPGPPPKTGKHRYIFLVFAPKNGTEEKLRLSMPKERKHWGFEREEGGVRSWAERNGLVPVAANFIYAKNRKQ